MAGDLLVGCEIQDIAIQITNTELTRPVEHVLNVLLKLDPFMVAWLAGKSSLRGFGGVLGRRPCGEGVVDRGRVGQ